MAIGTWLQDKILGFALGKDKKTYPSFAVPESDDGAINLDVGGAYGTYLDMEGKIRNEVDLITKYREISLQNECDAAIEDIVNEAIVMGDTKPPLELELSEVDHLSDKVKKRIYSEFQYILHLLEFDIKAHEIFRKWYVDGKVYYHMIIDETDKGAGIKELRYIDPRKMRKVRELVRKPDDEGVEMIESMQEFYIYDEVGVADSSQVSGGIKVHTDSIASANSGLYDHASGALVSYLHKAIKPLNQLRMMEDAVVIYRIARAPERRIFYIDVGNLPKAKAEQYLRDMMVKHRNKLVYDASTGEIKDDRKHMNMLEDYWLPRREGGRGTEIQTLPGGQSLGELEDIEYFQKKLYKSLNVPVTRLQEDNSFSLGRDTEITRDELKFSKFILRLRNRFLEFPENVLKAQLVLKGIIKEDEWNPIKDKLHYKWSEDSYYREIKNSEMLRDRLSLVQDVADYSGKFFSIEYIRREVLQQSQEEMDRMDREMEQELQKGKYGADSPYDNMGMMGMGDENKDEPVVEEPVEEFEYTDDDKDNDTMHDLMDNILNGNYNGNGNGTKEDILMELKHEEIDEDYTEI